MDRRAWVVVVVAALGSGGACHGDDGAAADDGRCEPLELTCEACVDNQQTYELRTLFLEVLASEGRDEIELIAVDHYVNGSGQHAVVEFEVSVQWYRARASFPLALPKVWYDLPLDELREIMLAQVRAVPRVEDELADPDTIREALQDCDPLLEYDGCGGGADFVVHAGRDWYAGECTQHNSYATVDARTGELTSCVPDDSHDICETGE